VGPANELAVALAESTEGRPGTKEALQAALFQEHQNQARAAKKVSMSGHSLISGSKARLQTVHLV
jgi:hypothetical protein